MKKGLIGMAAALVALAALGAAVAAEGRPGVDRSRQLVIYTNSGSEGRGDWLKEKAAVAGFNLAIVDMGGGAVTERLVAEKNNPLCDVVFGLNALGYVRLAKNDILIPYTPGWASGVDKSLASPDGLYHPIVVQPLLMIYNTDVYSKDAAPKDWTTLAESPAYQGKHSVLALAGGTCQAIIASILTRFPDPSGEYGISAEGWDLMRKYIQSGHIVAEGEDFFGNVTSGKIPVSQLWGSGLLQRYDELKVTNVDYASPAIGVPFVVEQIAICKGSENVELAKDFIDWFGAADVQGDWAERFGTIPAHPGARARTSASAQEMMRRVHPQKLDWFFIADNIEHWMEKIQLEFML